jgi:hypothetical protein
MNSTKITRIIFIIAGMVLGIGLTNLYRGCGNDCPAETGKYRPIVKKQATAKEEKKYKEQTDSFKEKNRKLAETLAATKKNLEKAGNKTHELQTQVADLTEQYIKASENRDTIKILEQCDSLIPTTGQMVAAEKEQDSLNRATIEQLEVQAANKDTIISIQEERNGIIKQQLENSEVVQEQAIIENKKLRKQLKRQKIKGKMASLAAVIVSGITLKWLLQH